MNLNQLANVALLGTQRSSLPTLTSNDAILGALKTISDEQVENKLLSLAGTLSLYEQAGTTPPRLRRVVNDVPLQDKPKCNPNIAKYLSRLLEGQHTELLPEFLTALAEAGYRVPEETLPILFDRARNVYYLRIPLLAAMGETGRWLARQNSAWYFADVLTFERASADWKSNVLLARQGIVKQARVNDVGLGLELIESTWKTESPTDRTWIIKALRTNITLADEPFLETALDDRSFSVRKTAAELLSVLPASRLSKRMMVVAETMVELRDAELFIEFPDITPQLMRDGVGRPVWNDAEKVLASQLNDIVSLLPLTFWHERFNVSPEYVIDAAKASIWSKSLMGGLANAIERQATNDWALALLMTEGYNPQTMKVLPVLLLSQIDVYVTHLHESTKDYSLWVDNVLLKVMSRWLQPWSETMSDIWLTRLHTHLEQAEGKTHDSTLESTLKTFSRFCPPFFIERAIKELSALSQHEIFRKACIEPLLILEFRQKMLKAVKG
jgi:Family of unknown function (DUF5691)